jgi:hypothetical protein
MNPAWFRPTGLAQWLLVLLLAATLYTLGTEPLDFAENQVLQPGLMVMVALSLLGFGRQAWRSR